MAHLSPARAGDREHWCERGHRGAGCCCPWQSQHPCATAASLCRRSIPGRASIPVPRFPSAPAGVTAAPHCPSPARAPFTRPRLRAPELPGEPRLLPGRFQHHRSGGLRGDVISGLFIPDENRSLVTTDISKNPRERKPKMSNRKKKRYMIMSGLREEKERKK